MKARRLEFVAGAALGDPARQRGPPEFMADPKRAAHGVELEADWSGLRVAHHAEEIDDAEVFEREAAIVVETQLFHQQQIPPLRSYVTLNLPRYRKNLFVVASFIARVLINAVTPLSDLEKIRVRHKSFK